MTSPGAEATRIRIPPTLRDATGGEREVQVEGATIRTLLEELVSRFPALRSRVYDGEVVPFVNIYVDGVDIRAAGGLEAPVPGGSTVILLPAMAGGAAEHCHRAISRLIRSRIST